MAKGSLNKKEQSKLKTLSKIIAVIAKIGRIFIYIGIISLLVCMIVVPSALKHVKAYDNKIEFKYDKDTVLLVKDETDKVKVIVNDKKSDTIKDVKGFDKLYSAISNHSNKVLIGYSEAFLLLIILYMYLISLVLKHLEKLFKNISRGDTPFTLDNVDHMRRMAIYMIVAIVVPPIVSLLFSIFTDLDVNISFDLIDVVQILFIYAMSFVFRYGYKLQEDSKKTIYDDEE